ncbi:MAG: sigma-70 family RNA polymerase sigma factor [Planctomycetota bacterium]
MTSSEQRTATTEGAKRSSSGDRRERSFRELMQDLASGSDDAAWTIVERYTPHILRVIRASLPKAIRSKVDSTDLANTLLGSLLLKRSRLRRLEDPAQLIALLTKAARNRVIDEHRKYTQTAARSLGSEEARLDDVHPESATAKRAIAGDGRLGGREQTPSQIAIGREKWASLVSDLNPREREVIKLRIGGSTYAEIAGKLKGTSDRTARRIVANIVRRLEE